MDRATIYDHIEQLKARPAHVRHRVAFGTAVGFTGVVAVVWLAVLIFSGNLALNPMSTGGTQVQANAGGSGSQNNSPQSPFAQLIGGVNAALSGASTSPAALTSVDQNSSAQNSANGNGYGYTDQNAGANGYTEPATTTTTGTGGDQTTISF